MPFPWHCSSNFSSVVGVSCAAVMGLNMDSLRATIKARARESVAYCGLGESKRSETCRSTNWGNQNRPWLPIFQGKKKYYWAEYNQTNLCQWLCCVVKIALWLWNQADMGVLRDVRKINDMYISVWCQENNLHSLSLSFFFNEVIMMVT